jgi:hypothetical protein
MRIAERRRERGEGMEEGEEGIRESRSFGDCRASNSPSPRARAAGRRGEKGGRGSAEGYGSARESTRSAT